MLIKALLIALWAGLCTLDQYGPQLGFRKPLLAGVGAGIILGDMKQGLIIGGTLELMWLGVNNVGAFIPPDVISGSIIGVAVGILSGKGAAAGVAVAVPVAVLVQQLDMIANTLTISLVHKADKVAETGDFDKIDKIHLLGVPIVFLTRAIPAFIVVYLGSPVLNSILNAIPKGIMTGLSISSKIIPAVGIAMLLTMMLKKGMWVFLLLGFTLATYLNLSVLPIAFLGITFATIYDMIMNRPQESKAGLNNTKADEISEGGLDL